MDNLQSSCTSRATPIRALALGKSHFPIKTTIPEVQQWFDQGVALLHSFWYYEAERSFRWRLKLEPDNAMAYWGLAKAVSGERAQDFLREAVKRKDKPELEDRESKSRKILEAQDFKGSR